MKHPRKKGKVIIDKDTKFVKKLLKKNPIILSGHIHYSDDCLIEITNIRKYDNCWFYGSNSKFVFEVDVKVKKNERSRWRLAERSNYRNRRIRSWKMETLIQDELCFFGISDICISKITYI